MPRIRTDLSAEDIFRRCRRFAFWEVKYPPGATHGPRIQDGLQLLIAHNTTIHAEAEDRTMSIDEGEAGLFLPGRREFFRFGEKRVNHMSWCSAPALPELMKRRDLLSDLPLKLPFNATMNAIMQTGLGLTRQTWPAGSPVVDALGMALFLEWLQIFSAGATRRILPEPVSKAETWMREHLGDPVDVVQIARAASVSPRHLSRLWRHCFNETILDHLWKLRLERAGEMLASTGFGIAEIGYQCGFQSPFHFSRRIRVHFGCSPRELRARSWNPPSKRDPRVRLPDGE